MQRRIAAIAAFLVRWVNLMSAYQVLKHHSTLLTHVEEMLGEALLFIGNASLIRKHPNKGRFLEWSWQRDWQQIPSTATFGHLLKKEITSMEVCTVISVQLCTLQRTQLISLVTTALQESNLLGHLSPYGALNSFGQMTSQLQVIQDASQGRHCSSSRSLRNLKKNRNWHKHA